MRRQYLYIGLLLGLLLLWATACSASNTEDAEEDTEHVMDEMDNMDNMDHMHVEAPDEFAGLTNSFAGDESAIAAGKEIFEANCATCHGPEGMGDGPASEGLDPKPATLADGTMMNTLADGYLFWRVSKGGAMDPWNSAMPTWENTLTEDQRWQVISYVRTLAVGEPMENMEEDHMDEGEHMEDAHMEEGNAE